MVVGITRFGSDRPVRKRHDNLFVRAHAVDLNDDRRWLALPWKLPSVCAEMGEGSSFEHMTAQLRLPLRGANAQSTEYASAASPPEPTDI